MVSGFCFWCTIYLYIPNPIFFAFPPSIPAFRCLCPSGVFILCFCFCSVSSGGSGFRCIGKMEFGLGVSDRLGKREKNGLFGLLACCDLLRFAVICPDSSLSEAVVNFQVFWAMAMGVISPFRGGLQCTEYHFACCVISFHLGLRAEGERFLCREGKIRRDRLDREGLMMHKLMLNR